MLDGQNIIGIGYDMAEVARIKSVMSRWEGRFENRVFTNREIEYCGSKMNRFQRLASRFAVKEAVFKALGTGWLRGVGWKEIEVTNDDLGKPIVNLSGRTEQLAIQMGVKNIFVSMTHTREYGAAQVIMTS